MDRLTNRLTKNNKNLQEFQVTTTWSTLLKQSKCLHNQPVSTDISLTCLTSWCQLPYGMNTLENKCMASGRWHGILNLPPSVIVFCTCMSYALVWITWVHLLCTVSIPSSIILLLQGTCKIFWPMTFDLKWWSAITLGSVPNWRW